MNVCVVSGNVVSDVDFKFIYGNKFKWSIALFSLKLLNGTVIRVKAYNYIADYFYRKIEMGMYVFLIGRLDTKMELTVTQINRYNIGYGACIISE
ncbi:MAG: hypothetical protein Q4G05_05225 [Clostridia bacterium]|nr:hypothetical protein [Clostridia bacterium]